MQRINVNAQKIISSLLETYDIVITAFLVFDKLDKSQFF